MIKVFTTNSNNKIELTKKGLESLLKEGKNNSSPSYLSASEDAWKVHYPSITLPTTTDGTSSQLSTSLTYQAI